MPDVSAPVPATEAPVPVPAPPREGPRAPEAASLPGEPAVRLDGVVKRFGATVAVNGASLEVPAGAVYGLIGPNGAGKTTTFSMICGFLKPSEGVLRVLGHVPGDMSTLKGRLGALPQDAALPANDRVGETLVFHGRLLGMSRPDAQRAAEQTIAQVGMSQWWNVRCGALSHGMAKRVGLAQAFLGNPELVLLDEPTAGLDPKSAFQLREFIKQQKKSGHTIVISSHNLHELEELCDAAAILDRGRVVAAGTMAELTRAVGEIRVLVASEPVPLDALRALPCVSSVDYQPEKRSVTIAFSTGSCQAEDVIADVLKLLLGQGVRISGVTKGRKLEERVMELT